LVLSKGSSETKRGPKGNKKEDRRAAAAARERGQELRSRAKAAEAETARLAAQRSAIDQAMFDPSGAHKELASLTMTELMKRRADLDRKLAAAEAEWLNASEALEEIAA
jgi:ATP-binding cassette subfamily F protein 3